MGYAYITFGIFCIIYYVVMAICAKRLTTTFSGFWLVFGALHVLLGCVILQTDKWLDWVIYGLSIACLAVFFIVELFVLFAMLRRTKKKLDCLIVLGAQIRGERVTDVLKRRLDKALAYLQENEETVCIVSGGCGKGEDISEALAMSRYLISCGIEEERIIQETESKSTRENLCFCLDNIEDLKQEKVGIVTNNFHVFRSIRIAKKLGYKKVYPITASCKPIYFLNYMTREFFAILYMMYKSIKEGK